MLKKSIAVVLLAGVAFAIVVLMVWVNINGDSRRPAAAEPPVAARQSPAVTRTNSPPAAGDEKTISADQLAADKLRIPHPCPEAKPGGPEEVVRSIYDDFPWGDDKSIQDQPREVLAKYFVPNLVELLLKNQKCHDNCAVIADIWNKDVEQTPPIGTTDFRVCAMDSRGNVVQVQLRDVLAPEIFLYKLKQVGSEWKVSDVIEPVYGSQFNPTNPGKSDGWSLMDTLSDSYASKN